jgi:hypothetical protein
MTDLQGHCITDRERERERERDKDRDRDREIYYNLDCLYIMIQDPMQQFPLFGSHFFSKQYGNISVS